MKEQDFDDIGKRLRDLEADPPQDGWKRIGGTLAGQPSNGNWFSRNWWKGMFLIIPAFLYIGYHEFYGLKAKGSLKAENVQADTKAASAESQGIATIDQQVPNEGGLENNSNTKKRNATDPGHLTMDAGLQNVAKPSRDFENSNVVTSAPNGVSDMNSSSTTQSTLSSPAAAAEIHADESRMANGTSIASKDENRPVSPVEIAGSAALVSPLSVQTDSVVLATTTKDPSVSSTENEEEASREESNPTWRMNVSVMPQYVNRTIQPLASDEVLVTKVEDENSHTRKGVQVGVGISRSLSEQWSLEGQLSYNNLSQEIKHSFSDGTVDTLLRVKQPDQSVRVTPVYHTTDREIKSSFHYASLSLGTTYYFWANTKRRFNLSVSGDVHYLVSAQIKEKINDHWVNLSDKLDNKTNYSLTIGAGYNHILYKGLELMIRPSLRYFARDISSGDLPYKLNQRSVGINFMLSKTIGRD